jgi:hypothetical protein
MANLFNPAPHIDSLSGVDGENKDRLVQVGALQVGDLLVFTPDNCASDIFHLDGDFSDPTDSRYGTASMTIKRVGPYFYIDIEFVDLVLEVTDAGAGGSYGGVNLGAFVGDDVCIQSARLYLEDLEENAAASFTGDTLDTSPVITNVSDITGLQIGATITGTGIGVDARIQSIDSATQITLTEVSTVTDTTVALTQPAISGGDTVFEVGLGTEEIEVEADGVMDGGDQNSLATISTDLGSFDEPSDSGAVAEFTDDSNIYINWSGTAATVDASGSILLAGNVKLIGVLLDLD